MMTETSTLTPLLKRLEKRGYLERKRCSEDERQVLVYLTHAGRQLQRDAPEITRCVIDSTKIPPANLAELVQTISRMRDNLQNDE